MEHKAASDQPLVQLFEELAEQRSNYLKSEVARVGGATESLDHQIPGALKSQAAKAGMRYEEGAVEY